MTLENKLSWGDLDVSELAQGDPRWFNVATIEDMFPSFYTESMETLSDVSSELAPTLETVFDLVNAIANLIPYFSTLPGFLVSSLIDEFKALITDLIDTGVYVILFGPKYGGSFVLTKRFSDSLLNPDDNYRPIVSASGSVGSISFVWGSPSSDVAAFIFSALGQFLSQSTTALKQQVQTASEDAKLAVDVETYKSYYSNPIVRKNLPYTAWWGYALKDLLPGSIASDVVQYTNNMLRYLDRLTTRNAFESFALVLLEQIAELTLTVAQLQQFLDELASVLTVGPLSAFIVPPATGGTSAWRSKMENGLRGNYSGPVFGTTTYTGMLTIAVTSGGSTQGVEKAWEALTKFYYAALQNLKTAQEKIGG